jgi:hypothetical protein
MIEPSCVRNILEAQVHPLTVAIPRFIQMHMPLPPLRLTVQSRRGVIQIPHTVIEPSALRAAKEYAVE